MGNVLSEAQPYIPVVTQLLGAVVDVVDPVPQLAKKTSDTAINFSLVAIGVVVLFSLYLMTRK